MNNIIELLSELFSNVFGFIVIFAVLQWLYRNFISPRRNGNDETATFSLSSKTVSKYDMGTRGSTGYSDVKEVTSSDRGRVAFTEKDMYLTNIEENMTYSDNPTEVYDNPKELYDAGLVTFREYMKMIPNRKRGGN